MRVVAPKCSGQPHGYVGNIASRYYIFSGSSYPLIMLHASELAEPQKLLMYILQPEISRLSPETIAVYIQTATKIFGFWATEVAERWTNEDLPEVRGVVDLIVSRVTELVSNPHIEVQERVSHPQCSSRSNILISIHW